MISGFGGGSRREIIDYTRYQYANNLPIPFNIPNVLYNLLFADIGIEFDNKQQDIMTALKFSYTALGKMESLHEQREQEVRAKIVQEPENQKLKDALEEMQLDRLDANSHFKDLVIVISEMLTRDQYTKLMKFCGLPT